MTAVDWRKSSRCQTGECIEVADWRKSTRSSHNGQCVEAGTGDAVVGVRDSTDRGGPALTFAPDAWRAFTAALKALPVPPEASLPARTHRRCHNDSMSPSFQRTRIRSGAGTPDPLAE